jgi:hypothetical protein
MVLYGNNFLFGFYFSNLSNFLLQPSMKNKIIFCFLVFLFHSVHAEDKSVRAVKFQCDLIEKNLDTIDGKVLKVWFDKSKNYWMLMSDLNNRLVLLVYPEDSKKQSCIVNFGIELQPSDWATLGKE